MTQLQPLFCISFLTLRFPFGPSAPLLRQQTPSPLCPCTARCWVLPSPLEVWVLPGLDVTLCSPGTLFAALVQMHPRGGQQCDPEGAKSGLEKPAQLHNTSSSARAEPAPARMEWASPPGSWERWSQIGLGLVSSPQAQWTDPAEACQCPRRWVLSRPFQRAIGNLHPSPEQPGWVRPCGPSSHPPGTSSGSTAHLSSSSPSPAEAQELGRRILGWQLPCPLSIPTRSQLVPSLPSASQAAGTRGLPQIGDTGSSRACCPRWVSRSRGARHAGAACLRSPLPPAFVWAVGCIQGRAPSSSSFQVPRHITPGWWPSAKGNLLGKPKQMKKIREISESVQCANETRALRPGRERWPSLQPGTSIFWGEKLSPSCPVGLPPSP